MSPLIAVLVILVALIGIVAFIVWKVLTAPIAPPAAQMEANKEVAPASEKQPESQATGTPQARPSEYVQHDSINAAPESSQSSSRLNQKTAAVLAAAVVFPGVVLPVLAARAIGKSLNPRKLPGGDEDLSRRRRLIPHREKEVPVLRVQVSASGRITLDGNETSLADLDTHLTDLKARDGKVFFWREPAEPESPQAAQALSAMFRIGVPVSFATKGEQQISEDRR